MEWSRSDGDRWREGCREERECSSCSDRLLQLGLSSRQLLALHATLRVLKEEPSATARWVDTEGAFNASRAQAVLTALGADVSAILLVRLFITSRSLQASVLDRLTVSRVFRLEPELLDVLAEARNDPSTRVLVVDNIATLFRDALMGTTAQG